MNDKRKQEIDLLNKKYSQDFDLIVDKLAKEIMKAEKLELNATNIVETVRYLEATPQVRNIRKALALLDVILANFEIGLFKNPETRMAIYSNQDDYCVCHTIPSYKWEELPNELKEALNNIEKRTK